MPRRGGFKPPVRFMALAKRHSGQPTRWEEGELKGRAALASGIGEQIHHLLAHGGAVEELAFAVVVPVVAEVAGGM
jgi:hypothetical protein